MYLISIINSKDPADYYYVLGFPLVAKLVPCVLLLIICEW
jgi:hypothetical protein